MSEELATVSVVGMTVVALVILGLAVLFIGGKMRAGTNNSYVEIESSSKEDPAR